MNMAMIMRTKSYLIDDLENVRLTREHVAAVQQDVSFLHLDFRDKTLVISELTIAYSVEHLLRTIQHHYFVSAAECE